MLGQTGKCRSDNPKGVGRKAEEEAEAVLGLDPCRDGRTGDAERSRRSSVADGSRTRRSNSEHGCKVISFPSSSAASVNQ
eukprot:3387967-Rhodomonas_salina.1